MVPPCLGLATKVQNWSYPISLSKQSLKWPYLAKLGKVPKYFLIVQVLPIGLSKVQNGPNLLSWTQSRKRSYPFRLVRSQNGSTLLGLGGPQMVLPC